VQTESAYTAEVMKLMVYIERKEDPQIQVIWEHQHYYYKQLTILKNLLNVNQSKQKNITAQNIKKRMQRQFSSSL
jgi:hypothetical protein